MDSSSGLGAGVFHPESLYYSAKVANFLDCVNTTSRFCRETTLDTVADIRMHTGIDVTKPTAELRSNGLGNQYPLHYAVLGQALFLMKSSVVLTDREMKLSDVPLETFVRGKIPSTVRERLFKRGWDQNRALKDAIPSMLASEETGDRAWRSSPLGRALLAEDWTVAVKKKFREDVAKDLEEWVADGKDVKGLKRGFCAAVEAYRSKPHRCPIVLYGIEDLLYDKEADTDNFDRIFLFLLRIFLFSLYSYSCSILAGQALYRATPVSENYFTA
jgi:hypothetical protein